MGKFPADKIPHSILCEKINPIKDYIICMYYNTCSIYCLHSLSSQLYGTQKGNWAEQLKISFENLSCYYCHPKSKIGGAPYTRPPVLEWHGTRQRYGGLPRGPFINGYRVSPQVCPKLTLVHPSVSRRTSGAAGGAHYGGRGL